MALTRGHRRRCSLLALILLPALLPARGIAAQADLMAFQALGQRDGLSQSTVNASFQDAVGYMWFATENGLNRYDGHGMRSYLRDRGNPGAPESDFFWALAEDSAGDLWLASEGAGLIRWRRRTDRFATVLDQRALDEVPARRLARTVHIDSAGHIWVGTRGAGLLEFDASGTLLRSFRHAADDPSSLSSDAVSVIRERRAGGLWIGTGAGLDQLDPASGTLRRHWAPSDGQPAAVSDLLEDRRGRLWVGSFESGLYLRKHADGVMQHLRHDPSAAHSLSNDQVRALLEDRDGRIWVATQGGLNLFRPRSGDFIAYRHDDRNRYSLSDDRLMSLFQDRAGLLWVGSRTGGVNRWNPRSWTLGAHAPPALAGAYVLAFADSRDGAVWVGSYGAGLVEFDRDGRPGRRFDSAHGLPDLGQAPVTALLRDRQGALWIGTMGEGLKRHDPETGRLDELRHRAADADSLGADGIMSLFEDRDGRIWAGTFGGGPARVDPQTLAVERITGQPGDSGFLAEARITAFAQGVDGSLWLGTDGHGLVRLDADGGSLSHYRYNPSDPDSLGSDTVYALHLDANGTLWIGTAGAGLMALPPAAQRSGDRKMIGRSVNDGLSSNVINGIRSAADGRLWLSSNSGLMRFDPASGKIDAFHVVHGLISEEFNYGAHHRSADGRLYFGATGGFNAFDPAAVRNADQPPPLVLSGLEKFNQPVDLERPADTLRQLVLDHDDDVITFEYAALDYTAPERNQYSVLLQGFDRDWSAPSTRNRSTYTNLDAGNYLFRVRAANSDGVWTRDSLDIQLTVNAAPWASPWAYAFYLLCIAGAVQLFFRWRLRELEREARIRQLAFYDKVTGLPNRDLFELRLSDALARAQENGETLDVICLRLGATKLADSLGHRPLDDLLKALTNRVSLAVFGSGHGDAYRDLARLGDDTLGAFIRAPADSSERVAWPRRLLDAINAPLLYQGHEVSAKGALGIASFPADATDAQTLLKCAITAAADAAGSLQQKLVHYESAMTERALERLALESDLRRAIAEDALELHLQGKFSGAGELVGAEALCRWQHPQKGRIPPSEFVSLAEESELITELDRWMIGRARAVLQDWQTRGCAMLPIAVNISATSFSSGRILDILSGEGGGHAIAAAMLEIEITESVVASDIDQVTALLQRIKSLGHPVTLDDFGTGYSSLTYLQRFPVDKLKIDRSFVDGLESEPDQQALCAAVIALAESLKLRTVAEGIELQAQLDLLREMGCDQFQGFFLHRPQTAAAFTEQFLADAVKP